MRRQGCVRRLLCMSLCLLVYCALYVLHTEDIITNGMKWNSGYLDGNMSDHQPGIIKTGTGEKAREQHPPNVCTQEQRLSRMDEMCEKYYAQPAKPFLIDNMTDEQVIRLGQEFFVVDEFKLLGCLSWKTGSTSWTLMLINNTETVPLGDSKYIIYDSTLKRAAKEKRVLKLNDFSPPEIRMRLKTYWKFLTVRHPLDRLVSAYNDKLVNNKMYRSQLTRKIRGTYNNTNKTKGSEKQITFKEFLQYVRDGGQDIYGDDGGHWHDLMVRCQPCTVDYDFLLRTETQFTDAPYIINHKMRGRGLNLKTKSWRRAVDGRYPYFGRKLNEYQSIPDELFTDIIRHYEKDFAVYGYDYKRVANGSVITECTGSENNGDKCC